MSRATPFFAVLLALLSGCAASRAAGPHEAVRAMVAEAAQAPAAAPLVVDVFERDRPVGISEEALRMVLDAPVFLEEGARIGVVPVEERYDPDGEIPTVGVPGSLARALHDTGLFAAVSEVSTDFPATRSIAGLRELAARYRADYLLLYRHRFVDRTSPSAWAWANLTVVGAFLAPTTTVESAGVLEATLFDVKSGTLLFTVFERVRHKTDENPFDAERRMRERKEKLLVEAEPALGDGVVEKVRQLAAARLDVEAPSRAASRARSSAVPPTMTAGTTEGAAP